MNILLIRLRLIGDVVFTTPIPRALKRAFPDARLTYLVEAEAAPVVAGNPHIDELIVDRPDARAGAASRTTSRSRGGCARARFDLVDRSARRPAQLVADAGDRRAAADRLRHPGPELDVHPQRCSVRASCAPRHSVVNQWDLLSAIDGLAGDAARSGARRGRDAARSGQPMPHRGSPARGWHVDAQHPVIVVHVSAGNPFRRWPEPAFVAARRRPRAATDGRRRIVLSSGPSDRAAADRIAAAARAALGPAAADRVVDFGEFDLAELRALIGRSRLFIGGDTGPLHIAATTRDADRRDLRPDAAGAIGAVAGPAQSRRVRARSTGLPCRPVRPAGVRAGRFSMPDDIAPGRRDRGRGDGPAGRGARVMITRLLTSGT